MLKSISSLACLTVVSGLGPSQNTTHPFWLDNAEYQTFRSTPELPKEVDHLVIGAGGAGVSTSFQLTTKYKKNVLLLDARGVCGGASGRNSGGVGAGIDWVGSVKQYGEEFAKKLLKDSTDKFQEFIDMNQAADCKNCWIRVGGSASFYNSPANLNSDAQGVIAQQAAGLGANISVWNSTETSLRSKSQFFAGATYSTYAGNVWGAKYVFTLTRKALATGLLNLQTQTLVTSVTKHESGNWQVITNRGTVLTKKVVFATNAYTKDILSEGSWITPVRGQIVMTEKNEKLWDFDTGMDLGDVYMHQQPTGEVLLGGMRKVTKSGQMGTTDDSQIDPTVHGALSALVPEFFPSTNGIPIWRSWTGIMGFSKDYKPLVGELPDKPNAYIVAGFTGGGIQAGYTFGKATADIIATGSPPAYWQTLSRYYDQFLATRIKGKF
eukprot:TRINITY_DN8002_c0_g1_i1.p1 TRINITY_DN8002_c0_g1~~TRINITY_DN8002_c0_g1_i1.p1  ORF type:complete len:437 (+),score=78.07 TRINITY_DN8002_c0_g1_i1:198-1508(+)